MLSKVLLICVCLSGCTLWSTNRDTTIKTVETRTVQSEPIQVETPIGTFTIQPARIQTQQTQETVEQEVKHADAPVEKILPAVAASSPWGALLGGLVGFGGVAGAVHQMLRGRNLARQRDELIDGIERAKDDLGDKWESLTSHLEAEQSRDTKQIVKDRVG